MDVELKDGGISVSAPGGYSFSLSMDVFPRWHRVDENGDTQTVVDVATVLAPIDLAVKVSETGEPKKTTLYVPFEYARMFDTAPTGPEHERLTRQLSDMLCALRSGEIVYVGEPVGLAPSSEAAHRAHLAIGDDNDAYVRSYTQGPNVSGITLQGLASPEGPRGMGSRTVETGSVDRENIELADLRRDRMEPLMREALLQCGIHADDIERISGEEVQFSEKEWGQLLRIAKAEGYEKTLPRDTLFDLIHAYNNGKITDHAAKAELDAIMGSKRGVRISVEYRENDPITYVVPLPLLIPLFAFFPKFHTLFHGGHNVPVIDTRRIFNETVVYNEENEESFKEIYDKVRQSSEWKRDAHVIAFLGLRDEILRHWDDYDERGAEFSEPNVWMSPPYKVLLKEAWQRMHAPAEGQMDHRLHMAQVLLKEWEHFDRKWTVEQGAEIGENEVDPNDRTRKTRLLDYARDPRKVLWARVLSEELVTLLEVFRKDRVALEQTDSPFFDTKAFGAFLVQRTQDMEKARD